MSDGCLMLLKTKLQANNNSIESQNVHYENIFKNNTQMFAFLDTGQVKLVMNFGTHQCLKCGKRNINIHNISLDN